MRSVNGEELDLTNDYNFLMLCNDFIVDILKYADEYQWSSEKINIKEKDMNKFGSPMYDLFYFRNHGYANVINKSLYKHIIFSLVSDYNNYVFDAINCALRYHFGTAYTLLRKPFKDDLFLLEMIYVKGYRFIPEFLNKPIRNLSIDKISKDDKMKILRKCCKKINFFTAKKLYNLRYSKKSKESLEKIWNKTSHIITNAQSYATEDGNLNIIFATPDIVEENLVYFYKVCCSMQLYFIILILNILKDEKLISSECFNQNITNLYFAFSCILDSEIPIEIVDELKLKCSYCGSIKNITKEMLNRNNKNKVFKFNCDKCKKTTIIDGFKLS